MTLFDPQLAQVQARYAGAHSVQLPSGTRLVVVPGFPLPTGWNRPSTTVRFIVQPNYPFSQPDCFWADGELRLASGGMPQNTGVNPIPEAADTNLLWFSWHLQQPWNPTRDTLSTWLVVVSRRFGHLS